MLNFAKTRPCYHLLIKQIVTVFILLAVTGSIIFACENSSTKTETLSVDLLTAIEKENIVATYNFGGHEIPAIVAKGNLIG